MVITIGPRDYLPERKFDVRIKRDILVTTIRQNDLTFMVPKTVKDI